MREVRWERMFPDELEAAFARFPVAWFSYGLCEPHGPQNTVGLDALKAHAICCAAAHAHGGIVAPPDYWHIHELGRWANWLHKSVGQPPRAWMTAVPPWHHFKNVCYHIRAAEAAGFHAAIFLTGHYGPNWVDLKTMLGLLQPHVGTRLYGLPDFEANVPGFANDGKSGADHAGRVETSLLWALEPSCVDVSRIPKPGDPGAPYFAMGPNAAESDRRVGERMVADEVRWLGDKARELLAEYDRIKPAHGMRTFTRVEELWETLIRPQIPQFKSMEWIEAVPEDSRWRENQTIPKVT
jgi:creatinine amidohydrolase